MISVISRLVFFYLLVCMTGIGCTGNLKNIPVNQRGDSASIVEKDSDIITVKKEKELPASPGMETITAVIPPDSIVAFAKTLIGIPYIYASTDPAKGFDCSGFITYVFNHFNISVPRSSVDFTNYGKEISIENARPGDLVLFTGTDSTVRIVGHMGIVEHIEDNKLWFIHSTSGKGKGVVITAFENYYQSRFVKMIRVFPDELFR